MTLKAEMKYSDREWLQSILGNPETPLASYKHLENLMHEIEAQIITGKRMRKSSALEYSVLEYLAVQGSSTQYAISKGLNVSISSLHNAILLLESVGFIRLVDKKKWRTGLERKLYAITSIGLAPVLAFYKEREDGQFTLPQYLNVQRWYDSKVKRTYFPLIIQKNVDLPVYSFIFQHWDLVEQTFREAEKKRSVLKSPIYPIDELILKGLPPKEVLEYMKDVKNEIIDMVVANRMKHAFKAENILHLFHILTSFVADAGLWICEEGGRFTLRTDTILNNGEILKKLRSYAEKEIALFWFNILSDSSFGLLQCSNILSSFYLLESLNKNKLWRLFISTHKAKLKEAFEFLINKHHEDLETLQKLNKALK